jgi:hypothetical protein
MTRIEEKEGEEKEKLEMPGRVNTFDPENPPYQTQRLCVYLRELEEERDKEESEKKP